jgi:hypothetical protein
MFADFGGELVVGHALCEGQLEGVGGSFIDYLWGEMHVDAVQEIVVEFADIGEIVS